jgi:hypothetical protein
MRFPLVIAGLDPQRLSVESGGWRREPVVMQDDRPVPKDPVSDRTILQKSDGGEVAVLVRRSALLVDPVPYVEVDGKPIQIAPDLRWNEVAWISAPLLLAFVGGLLGALIGACAAVANLWVIRAANGRRGFRRTALITIAAASVFLILTTAAANLTNARAREAANQATERFHAQVDAGQCAQIYAEADEQFRTASAEAWQQSCADLRAKADRFVSATLQQFVVRERQGGSSTRTYAEASYRTTFANVTLTETFFWIVSDSPPRLAGYHADSSR